MGWLARFVRGEENLKGSTGVPDGRFSGLRRFFTHYGVTCYDRYARPKLLALASLIWRATTWLNALARSFPIFQITRASTGVDDSSHAGLFSLTSDYFPPKLRGRVYGLLQVAMPLGFMMGMVLGLFMGSDDALGWRKVFILTGSLGIILAVGIYFSVKERPRGQSEPELADIGQTGKFSFNNTARGLFKIKSLPVIHPGFLRRLPLERDLTLVYRLFKK